MAAWCAKAAECDDDVDEGDCRDDLKYDDGLQEAFRCTTEGAVSDVAGCMSDAGCRTIDDDFEACVRGAGL